MVKLNLSYKRLTEVPPIPDDVTILELSYNQITELKEGVFPQGLKKLYLVSNEIVELKKNVFPAGLQILNLSYNQIVELKEGVFPQGLINLYLHKNQITQLKENIFPQGLQELYLSDNKIVELKENVFPQGLQELFLHNNQIVELKENVFPQGLKALLMSNNQIVKLKKIYFHFGLEVLYLSNNQIVKLKEGVFPPGLKVLSLSENKIVELKKGVFTQELQELSLLQNKIIELKEGVFPQGLQELYLSNNQIVELPIHLLNLRRLTNFSYSGNPIENISLPVQRWLDRLNRRLTPNNKVYSDGQNIHNSNIQKSFCKSLEYIMKDKLTYSLDECKNALLTSGICEEVKREILNYCDDKSEHSIYLITFEDLFHYVMNRILIHQEKDEILKILEEEIKDTICKCFTGRLTRLLNVLNGFYPDIQIQIGSNEQITNVILMLKEKYEGEELKEKVRMELKERGYEEGVIEEWISFIE